jgi:hypothetical protein
MKLGVSNRSQLMERVLETCHPLDMEEMVLDVRNFLFYPTILNAMPLNPVGCACGVPDFSYL